MNRNQHMELFSAKETFRAPDEFVPMAMRAIKEHFKEKGFTYKVRTESYSRTIVQIQQGGMLLQAAGLRRGAVIIFMRHDGQTDVEVRECVIRNQVVGPAIISHYVPKLRTAMLVTAAFGLAKQANLSKEIMGVVVHAYRKCSGSSGTFCPFCGATMSAGECVCPSCGNTVAVLAIEQ